MKDQESFKRAKFPNSGNGYPQTCVGCAHTSALKIQSGVKTYDDWIGWQKYALASAMFAYDMHLQSDHPQVDLVAFLKACAPTAYTDEPENHVKRWKPHHRGQMNPMTEDNQRRNKKWVTCAKSCIQAALLTHLEDMASGEMEIQNRMLTYCVACGSARHSLQDCDAESERVRVVREEIQAMRLAIHGYPELQSGRNRDVNIRPTEETTAMHNEVGSRDSSLSTPRRPKAKARPRRATVAADFIFVRYDSERNLFWDINNRRGRLLACGVELDTVGPVNNEKVCELIEGSADLRDHSLPRRGDDSMYAYNADAND